MAEKDFAPATYRNNRPSIQLHYGIEVVPRGEFLMADRQVRSQRSFHSEKLIYNAAKWELALDFLHAWKSFNGIEFEAHDAVDEIECGLPVLVKLASDEWYRAEAGARAAGKKTEKFEPSFARFPDFFAGLKRVRAGARGRTKRVIDELIRALSALTANDYPVQLLAFIPDTPKDHLARKKAEKAARAAAANALDGEFLYTNARKNRRPNLTQH